MLKRKFNIHLFPRTVRTLPSGSIIRGSQERHVLGTLAIRVVHVIALVNWNAMVLNGTSGFGSHHYLTSDDLPCMVKITLKRCCRLHHHHYSNSMQILLITHKIKNRLMKYTTVGLIARIQYLSSNFRGRINLNVKNRQRVQLMLIFNRNTYITYTETYIKRNKKTMRNT